MVYTVTLNPSLDYIVSVDDFRLGLTNRTKTELMMPGGKGINVSTVLCNLGIESTALGFVAGFIVAFGGDSEVAETVSGCILSGAAVIGYVIGEGLADGSHTSDDD